MNDYDPLRDYLKRQTLTQTNSSEVTSHGVPSDGLSFWSASQLPIRRPAFGEDEAGVVFGGSTPPMLDSLLQRVATLLLPRDCMC